MPLAGGGRTSGREAVGRMVGALRHRGPDGAGVEVVYQDGALGAVLSHTRLAVLDLSPAGTQPMHDPATGNWITFNGEVYNFRELRASLPEPPGGWRSRTDTEVVLQAYAAWGHDCLRRLRGMFAFALWDATRQKLLLARDRLGIKPLYYFASDDFFLFASEVRALLASGLVPRDLDLVALGQYLAYQCVPGPRTLVQGVRALPPGSWLGVGADGRVTQGRYWDLLADAAPEARAASPATARQRVGELLREAVALHLVSDVPVGVFLSGGIDSTALAALVREAGQTPRTFTVVFPQREYDESACARLAASRFGAEHAELRLDEAEALAWVPEALAAMDRPSGDGVNTYLVARAVRQAGIKVALSGLGGDELFGGYPSFVRLGRLAPAFRLWGKAPAALRSAVARAVEALGRSSIPAAKAAAMLAGDGSLAALYPVTRQVLSLVQRRALLAPAVLEALNGAPDPYVALLRRCSSQPAAERSAPSALALLSYAEARTYMHDLLLSDTDQMAMAHGLEARVPFLDHVLASYVVGLPDRLKRSSDTPKRLLVEALDGLLPEEVVRRRKHGFTLPFDVWMRGPLRAYCEVRLAPERLGARGLLRPDGLARLWQDYLARRPTVSWSRLWMLVALEEWLERNGF